MRTRGARRAGDREWVLLSPGPVNITPTVRQALLMGDVCHREREFVEMMRRCRDRLVRLAAPGGFIVIDDLTPAHLWPADCEWRIGGDPVRQAWKTCHHVTATELLLTPETAAILAVRLR